MIQLRKDIEQYKDPERVEGDAIQIKSNGIVFSRNKASVLKLPRDEDGHRYSNSIMFINRKFPLKCLLFFLVN